MKKATHTKYETGFTVFPQDTNYMYPMLFGGKLLSEMDMCAASCVRRALYDSPCADAVTVKVVETNFWHGAEVKDLIFLKAEIVRFGIKSIEVKITGLVEEGQGTGERIKLCDGTFIFVSRDKNKKSAPHELSL